MTDLLLLALVLLPMAGAQWLLHDLRAVPYAVGRAGAWEGAGVSVVIPARDEESTLPLVLESLHRLAVDVEEVVVVDDGSRDATASVAAAAGARVLAAGEPPPGWTGKAWACHVGARASRGDLLLFLDADTVLAPDAVGGLLELRAGNGGLVSVQPFHSVVRPYEQLSAYFNLVSVMASDAFTPGRSRNGGRAPMAFGPCLLSSRTDYELAGGHAAVRGAILDDVALAAAYDRAGLPVTCAVGGRSVRMRSYPDGLGQLAGGWTKNIASGAGAAAPAATLVTVLWVSVHHAVAVGAVLALVEQVSGAGGSLSYGAPLLWALGWVAVSVQLRSILRRIGSFRWWTWVLFPVCLLAFDVVFARSGALTLVRRSVTWRGRAVDLREGPEGEGT